MSARAIRAEFARRGIWLSAVRGQIVARPKGATPPELPLQVCQYKHQLLRLLTWDPEAAASALRDSLALFEQAVTVKQAQIRDRIANQLALHGPTIASLFVAQDLDTLRDLARNVRNAVTGRGYDNEPALEPRPACKGACH